MQMKSFKCKVASLDFPPKYLDAHCHRDFIQTQKSLRRHIWITPWEIFECQVQMSSFCEFLVKSIFFPIINLRHKVLGSAVILPGTTIKRFPRCSRAKYDHNQFGQIGPMVDLQQICTVWQFSTATRALRLFKGVGLISQDQGSRLRFT